LSLRPFTAVLIIPTGIGARIGGYAGDALPVARAMAQVCDRLITHPNVMNGAMLYWPLPNTLYVEGYGLDQFAAGRWGLQPVHQNSLGLVLDQGIEPELQLRHRQAAAACEATLGLPPIPCQITDAPLQVELKTAASGATWGTIQNPDSLLRATEKLIQAGARAIAVVSRFPDQIDSQALANYRHGRGVDPLSGAEAVISHLVVREFRVPCAHAPALLPLPLDPNLSPRSAAEEIGYTFLPSVLVGLSRAPQFVCHPSASADILWAEAVDAVIIPATACGGSAILQWSHAGARIITVSENQTTLQVSAAALGLCTTPVNSYLEALGLLVAQRAGVSWNALQPLKPN
jgi:Protein of unknown function (DUF3326)